MVGSGSSSGSAPGAAPALLRGSDAAGDDQQVARSARTRRGHPLCRPSAGCARWCRRWAGYTGMPAPCCRSGERNTRISRAAAALRPANAGAMPLEFCAQRVRSIAMDLQIMAALCLLATNERRPVRLSRDELLLADRLHLLLRCVRVSHQRLHAVQRRCRLLTPRARIYQPSSCSAHSSRRWR